MRSIKLLGLAFLATLALSAVGTLGAESAAAFHPLFLTQSGKALLFTAVGLLWTLRGLNVGVLGLEHCALVLIHGIVLNDSPLIHLLKIIYHTDCLQELNGGKAETCNEPIETKPVLGELGLLLLFDHKRDIVLLVSPSDGTKVFDEPVCGGVKTTVEGAVIGEIPETSRGEEQINHDVLELLLIFRAKNKSEEQEYTSIELLGTNMTGAELKVAGFFGGKASWENEIHIKFDGLVLICTH